MLLHGTLINIELLLALLIVGLLVGTLIALLQVYGGRFLRTLASGYAWIFRSIPALVLLFLFYFGPTNDQIEAAWLASKDLLLVDKDVVAFAAKFAEEANK